MLRPNAFLTSFCVVTLLLARIVPPRPEFQQSITFLKSLSEKHNNDLDAAKTEHTEKIKKFKAEATVLYKGLEELKQATTVQVRVGCVNCSKVIFLNALRKPSVLTRFCFCYGNVIGGVCC